MKKLSIKMRITLWYTLLMIFIVSLVLFFMVFVSKQIATTDTKNSLLKIVNQNTEEVDYDDNKVEIDDDFIFMKNGVTTLVYSEKAELLSGYLQNEINFPTEFEDGTIQTLTIEDKSYYVYDRLLTFKQDDGVWIRGYVLTSNEDSVIHSIMKAAMWLFPLIIILAGCVGYIITRQSFKPINKMVSSVNQISEGRDLTERIDIGSGYDEIHQLADTFNSMFERLDSSFNKEKQFTSDVSHELRTPVSVILIQCDFTLENTKNTQEDYNSAITTIKRQATRMSLLINQLLTFARLDNGIEQLEIEMTNFSDLISAICEEQQLICKKEAIHFSYTIQPDIYLSIDTMMMLRVIVNLLNNARQYSISRGHIKVQLKQVDNSACLTLEDDGIGIDEISLPKIWERFYQVDASRTKNQDGSSGLGLAFVKQIIELHHGEISVESQIGKGTVFTLSLPVN